MARLKIFLSSTYYDMRQIRDDLDKFISETGYEVVRHEKGRIPYESNKYKEESCYEEIGSCDIVVSIIGGRFGTKSKYKDYSISQEELRRAFELGKQVYIFIEKSVLSEYETYLLNKKIDGVSFRYVESVKIYEFIEEVQALPRNNPIMAFENSEDIISFLREQWSGLFQRLLREQEAKKLFEIFDGVKSVTKTLKQLVTYLADEKEKGDKAIKEILLSNHPAFRQLRELLNVKYRIIFTNISELDDWLKARKYFRKQKTKKGKVHIWIKNDKAKEYSLSIFRTVFDEEGALRVFTEEQWNTSWINLDVEEFYDGPPPLDDDFPF